MTTTASQLRVSVLALLGDSTQQIWSSDDEIYAAIEDAMYDFLRRTKLKWRRAALDDVDGQATYTIPASYSFEQIDRAEYDYWVCSPVTGRVAMSSRGYFESAGNRPFSYMMDGDGALVLRKLGVPEANSTNTFYIEFIELWKLDDLDPGGTVIDLPERYLPYIMDYVMRDLLTRDGDGQDLKFADWFDSRYEFGVELATRRTLVYQQRRIARVGSDGRVGPSYGRAPGTLPPWYPAIK